MKKNSLPLKILATVIKVTCIPFLISLVFTSLSFAGDGFAQELLKREISIEANGQPLKTVLASIEQSAHVKFSYVPSLVDNHRVSISASKYTLDVVLDKLLAPLAIQYAVSGGHIILTKKQEEGKTEELTHEVVAPTIQENTAEETITGQVLMTDSNNPLPGVSVVLKGTTIGTTTNEKGSFQLSIPDNKDAVLVFSYVGYETQELKIGSQTHVEILLKEDTKALGEVIVVGYMTQKKADLTGSIAMVTAREIEKNSYSNVMQGLQGRLPGVYITGDGSPTGNVSVQIRGLTSMRSAPPLIVVDGFPTNINLRDINPNDIASIQVLKDAASASIYGSRAASGVILIETKKGKIGETKIAYTGSIGVSSFMNRVPMMNTQEFGRAFWQAAVNEKQDPNAVTQIYSFKSHLNDKGNPVLDEVIPREWLNAEKTMKAADTDWFDAGSQLGLQNNHQITLTNGNQNVRNMFSVNYYENRGTQIHTGLRRISLRLNSEYSLIKNRLSIGENIAVSTSKINDQNTSHSFLTMPPIIPVYTTDGGWGGTAYSLGMDDYNNPVRMLTLGKDNFTTTNKIIGSVYANLKILKNLSLKTQFGLDYTGNNYRHIEFTWVEGGGKRNINNGVRSYQGQAITSTWTNTLNYNLSLKNHSLDFLAGIETSRYTFQNMEGFRRKLELENYDYGYLSSATGTQEIYGTGDEYSLLSYFSKFNYTFKDKYLLSATLRYDGSSKFGINNQFGFFPAVSAGWRLSDEAFLKNVPFVSDLKIRASWGMNGNSNIPTNALVNFYDASYNATSYGLAGNESGTLYSGYRRRHIGNPNLKWEATRQTNLGVDFGIFGSKLTGSIDYFYKYTEGMLYEPPYLAAIGEGGYQWINAANMTNKGVELILTYGDKFDSGFEYSLTGNMSTFRNKVDDLPESVKFTYGGNGLDDDILGRPLNSIYGFVADGLFKSQEEVNSSAEQQGKGLGRIRYKDLDNDGKITWEHDRTWIGVSDPKFMYGLNMDSKFKNFDFSMFWQGIAGNTVRNDWKSYSDFWNVWTQSGFNHPKRLLGAWTPENYDSTIPALSLYNTNDERRVSTYFTESGSYLKLRHIELGYNLPVRVISKIGMKQFRVYLNAQNIVNLKKWWGANKYTGIDPENPTKANEYSSPYVRPQIFMMGINASF
ncbi:TonB-dependent receptor [Dyadobacter sp. LHD-138]|uniref:TonB-dependent receptor n=1 Tax=Dyadobacter sp. LHD-138 TaxID=3071413 RepID=UPI0027E02834|nr:TonB-dependent receptor [Dyadobacter sp. LHD-138]MDQ6479432.1 TonB-dependent receptor [Dyadobacter sp. LHD-138]